MLLGCDVEMMKLRNKSYGIKSVFGFVPLPAKNSFNSIDLVKFVCAFLICMVHIKFFVPDSFKYANFLNYTIQNYLCRIAVPFYFVVAGFLLYRKMNINEVDLGRIKNYCLKILRMLGVWTALLFVGSKAPLWYLGELVVAVLILSFLLKKKVKHKYIAFLIICLYIIGLFGDSYYGLILPLKKVRLFRIIINYYDMIFKTTRNGLFFGLIFVAMGAFISHKKVIMNFKGSLIGFIVSMVFLFFEVFFLNRYSIPKDHNLCVFLVPACYFMFCLTMNINLKNNDIYKRLRVVGLLIFFLHLLVNYFVLLGIDIVKRYFGIDLACFELFFTLLLVVLVSFSIERMSRVDKYKWLKYLYS